MSILLYGIKDCEISKLQTDEFVQKINESELELELEQEISSCEYLVKGDRGHFTFWVNTKEDYVLGSATRYGGNCGSLLEEILLDVFNSDYVLTDYDRDELISLGILEPDEEDVEDE